MVALEDKSISTAFLRANETFEGFCDLMVRKGWMEAQQAEDAKKYYTTVRTEEPLKGYRQLVFDCLCERYANTKKISG